jgi:predicted phage-related endonuclease
MSVYDDVRNLERNIKEYERVIKNEHEELESYQTHDERVVFLEFVSKIKKQVPKLKENLILLKNAI